MACLSQTTVTATTAVKDFYVLFMNSGLRLRRRLTETQVLAAARKTLFCSREEHVAAEEFQISAVKFFFLSQWQSQSTLYSKTKVMDALNLEQQEKYKQQRSKFLK